MSEQDSELSLVTSQSSFWKERGGLSRDELLELRGTHGMDRLVNIKSMLPYDVNFEDLSKELYREIFMPFGSDVREYRESNTMIIGGKTEFPDPLVVPTLMKEFSRDLEHLFKEARLDPENISKVIKSANKAHDIVHIHPFADGNGRVARGLVHYVLKRLGYILPSWRYLGRNEYLRATEEGKDNPKVFEEFLAGALIQSYKERERQFPQASATVASTRMKLENFLKSVRSAPVTV